MVRPQGGGTHQVVGDNGYQGLSKYFAGIDEKTPYKKPKNKELSKTKRAYNKAHSKRRMSVGIVFAHVKNWTRISSRYDGTAQEFNADFDTKCMTCTRCTGIEPTNLRRTKYLV